MTCGKRPLASASDRGHNKRLFWQVWHEHVNIVPSTQVSDAVNRVIVSQRIAHSASAISKSDAFAASVNAFSAP